MTIFLVHNVTVNRSCKCRKGGYMDNKAKIRYLSQYVDLGLEYQEIMQSYESYYTRALQAKRMSDMPQSRQPAGDKMADIMVRIEQLEDLLDARELELIQLRTDIENVIGRVSDSVHRRLLRLRYIDGEKWEQVAVDMAYSWQHIHRLHSSALDYIVVPSGSVFLL
jgi:hypothetical protein